MAPQLDAPKEEIKIYSNSIASQAIRTAILAPGIDPVIETAIVSPLFKPDFENWSIISAEKFGFKTVDLASYFPISVNKGLVSVFKKTKRVSNGSLDKNGYFLPYFFKTFKAFSIFSAEAIFNS